MKTLTTLLTLSLLALSTASYALSDGNEKRSKVPVAPNVWENSQIEVPESLKFLKAKNAYVPFADFTWGDPSGAPEQLLMVSLAPFVFGDSQEEAPEELGFIRAKYATVPVAPFVWGEASDEQVDITLK